MSTPKVSVTKAEHLVPGAVYRVVGTSEGKPIPPQAVRVETKPVFRSIVDPGHVEVTFFTNLGTQGTHTYRGVMWLTEVNIPEHGKHDRHLERVSDEELGIAAKQMRAENRKQEYTEMVVDDPVYQKLIKGMGNGTV
jgi:hypothetical protein